MNPDDLNAAGAAALEAVLASGLSREALVASAPVVEAYVLAVDLLERMQAEHRALGFPSTQTTARGIVGSHPLPGELRRQSRLVAELAKAVGVVAAAPRRMTGKNVAAPDRKANLRSVK